MNRLIAKLASAGLLALVACSGVTDAPKDQPDAGAEEEQRAPFDPTVARTPKPSKSLALAPNWQPPAPMRSRPAKPLTRVVPSKHYGVATRIRSEHSSDDEIAKLNSFPEPLKPVPGAAAPGETDALAAALVEETQDDRRAAPIERFLEAHAQSRWAPALHLDLGAISYHKGYFQDALAHWKAAWELAKAGVDPVSTDIANAALAQYAKMNARVGRVTELQSLIQEAQARTPMGDARVKVEGAAEGLWNMEHRPGISFMCGPYALTTLARETHTAKPAKFTAFMEKHPSPTTGFSIPEVQRMSSELGLKLQIAKRQPGAQVIVPSIVHWKVGHFGAFVRTSDGAHLLKDPTYGRDIWMTTEAVDSEASGYFLVPAGPLPSGWTRATTAETAQLYGKGYTPHICEDCTDPSPGPGPCGGGAGGAGGPGGPGGGGGGDGGNGLPMATYSFQLLVAGLQIEDTPVGYKAAAGPDVRVRVAYNQREASQPTTLDFTNWGPQFVSNWVSYLVDDTTNASADVSLRKRDGGGETNTNFNTTTQAFDMDRKTAAVLHRLTANTYEKVYPDGRAEYYEHYIGTTGTQRRVFLSRVVDSQGNEVAIDYDSTYPARIHQIVDATGLATIFHYDYSGQAYLVTSIDDPYGRSATFAYVTAASKLRLQSTEDPYGITSSFVYSGAGEIVSMTTPYGTTTFDLSGPYVNVTDGLFRYVGATDPLGQQERVEYNISTATGVPSTLETPRPSSSIVSYETGYNNYRNTFVWDKLAMKLAPGDYSKAHRYHWVHSDADTSTNILESEVPALEERIFYNYPGQSSPIYQGTLAFPSVVARVVKDATGTDQTQATKYEYNVQGNVTKKIDPVGRETLTEYDTNGVDVLAVKQRTGTSGGLPVWTTISTFAYSGSPPHRPSSMTDGAGQTTTYTYTSTGQIATITNAKSEVQTFTYETSTSSAAYDRVLSITGDVPGGNRSFTYDTYGRLWTTTDSDGYTLTYGYDSLDRVATITYPDASYEQFDYADHSLVGRRDREGRWTRHMYNGLRQRVLTQDPSLRTTQVEWCRCGKPRRFVDGKGNITEWQRDEGSRVTKEIQADGTYKTFWYDSSGRLGSETDAMSRTVTYSYTVDDRIAKRDYSDSGTPDVTYTFDTYFPRVASRVDGAGTTTFAYHTYGTSTLGAGQQSLVDGPLTDDTLKHTYDELGRLKKLEIVDDSTHSTATYSEAYTFDARGRRTAVQNNLGTSSYSYSGQSGRPTTVGYPNGMQVLYDYYGATGDFLLKQIKNLSSGGTPTVISQFDYTYRQDRQIATWKIDQGSGANTWTFGYDDARQLTSATLRDASMTVVEDDSYGYDPAGNRIQVASATTAPRNYEVNNTNELVSERDYGKTTFAGYVDEPATVKLNGKSAKVLSTDGGAPYKFEGIVDLDAGDASVVVEAKDGQNNTATKTYGVTSTGTSKNIEYDASGNLRYEKQPNGTAIREYRWDQQNRLVRMLAGTHESVYEYDGESKQVRIKELTSSVETKNETFIWCGSRICQKRSGSTVLRSYFGDGFEESGTIDYFYTRDQLGSVREVVGSNGATIASRLSYDPWGKITESGSGSLTDFAFTGHHFDRPTGVGLTWWRQYDPNFGRWLSKDPIGLRGGLNRYGYLANDPINDTDRTGQGPDNMCSMFGSLLPDFMCEPPPPPDTPKPPAPAPDPAPGGGGGAGPGGGGGFEMCKEKPDPDDCIGNFAECKNLQQYTWGNNVCSECLRICQGQGKWPKTTWSGRSCQ